MRVGGRPLGTIAIALIGAVMLIPSKRSPATAKFETAGTVFRANLALDAIVPPGATIEKLADDCEWTEGRQQMADTLTEMYRYGKLS